MNQKYPHLFQRYRLKSLDLKNRIVMAPVGTLSDNRDGSASDRMVEYYRTRARGGVGMITMECQYITNQTDPWIRYMTCAGTDVQMRGWSLIADAVHAEGAKLCIEMSCGQGRTAFDFTGEQMVAPSAIPSYYRPDTLCRPLTVDEIHDIVEKYRIAARNAMTAEADAINLHGHSGYLLDQFMTEIWNKRTDEYGGSFENRMRIIREIYEAIRSEVGPDFPIYIRISADHDFPGGRTLEEGKKLAQYLEKIGFDALDIDVGAYEKKMWLIPSIYMGDACMLDKAAEIKKAVSVPVLCSGTFTPELAEKALAEGKVDLVMFGRQLIADPDMPNKLLAGQEADVRPCLACNEFCIKRLYANRIATCAINPRANWEADYPMVKTESPRKVAVVGGGVGGIEAAITAGELGHDVTLYEMTSELHGQVRAARALSCKSRLRKYCEWQKHQLEKWNIHVVYNKEITAASPELATADAIIVAVGAEPFEPPIKGIRGEHVVSIIDAHLKPELVTGNTIVICGEGAAGCEYALELAEEGRSVYIIEMMEELVPKMVYDNREPLLIKLRENGVQIRTSVKVLSITDEGVETEDKKGKKYLQAADTVISAFGVRPRARLASEIAEKYPTAAIIGDACRAGLIGNAVRDGFFAAWRIH